MLFFVPPKLFISIVFGFSWELKWPQEETENNAYAKFWGDKQRALCYVTVFSGVVNSCNTIRPDISASIFILQTLVRKTETVFLVTNSIFIYSI